MKCLSGFILLVAPLVFACSKGSSSVGPTTLAINYSLVKEVEQLNDQTAAKLAYRMLNPQEKAILWQRQIDFYLNADLNADQKAHLAILRNYISPKLFDAGSNPLVMQEFTKPWEKVALTLFSKPLLANIVSGIHSEDFCRHFVDVIHLHEKVVPGPINIVDSLPGGAKQPDCNCNTQSDYCSLGVVTIGKCENGGAWPPCNYASSGCGTFWGYSCNGTCQLGVTN